MEDVVRIFPKPAMAYLATSKETIKQFKGKHSGRCFILGTGPSLNKTNLSLIKDEVIFGVNLLFQWEDRFGIKSTYYCLADHRGMWMYEHIRPKHKDVFLSCSAWTEFMNNMDKYRKYGDPHLIEKIGTGCSFSYDMSTGCYWGGTVVFDPGLQLAFYMGFTEVYLLGIDFNYSNGHYADPKIKSGGIPNLSHMENAYRVAKKHYEDAGRTIINCTPDSKLEVFEKKSLEDVLGVPRPVVIDEIMRDRLVKYWVNHVTNNVANNIRWYQGIPYRWWWGMTDKQFIDALYEHINDEEMEWKTKAR